MYHNSPKTKHGVRRNVKIPLTKPTKNPKKPKDMGVYRCIANKIGIN